MSANYFGYTKWMSYNMGLIRYHKQANKQKTAPPLTGFNCFKPNDLRQKMRQNCHR